MHKHLKSQRAGFPLTFAHLLFLLLPSFTHLLTQSASSVAVGNVQAGRGRARSAPRGCMSGALLAASLHLISQEAKWVGAALTSSAVVCMGTGVPCPCGSRGEAGLGFLFLCNYKHDIARLHQLRLWAVLLKGKFCKRFPGLCLQNSLLAFGHLMDTPWEQAFVFGLGCRFPTLCSESYLLFMERAQRGMQGSCCRGN